MSVSLTLEKTLDLRAITSSRGFAPLRPSFCDSEARSQLWNQALTRAPGFDCGEYE